MVRGRSLAQIYLTLLVLFYGEKIVASSSAAAQVTDGFLTPQLSGVTPSASCEPACNNENFPADGEAEFRRRDSSPVRLLQKVDEFFGFRDGEGDEAIGRDGKPGQSLPEEVDGSFGFGDGESDLAFGVPATESVAQTVGSSGSHENVKEEKDIATIQSDATLEDEEHEAVGVQGVESPSFSGSALEQILSFSDNESADNGPIIKPLDDGLNSSSGSADDQALPLEPPRIVVSEDRKKAFFYPDGEEVPLEPHSLDALPVLTWWENSEDGSSSVALVKQDATIKVVTLSPEEFDAFKSGEFMAIQGDDSAVGSGSSSSNEGDDEETVSAQSFKYGGFGIGAGAGAYAGAYGGVYGGVYAGTYARAGLGGYGGYAYPDPPIYRRGVGGVGGGSYNYDYYRYGGGGGSYNYNRLGPYPYY